MDGSVASFFVILNTVTLVSAAYVTAKTKKNKRIPVYTMIGWIGGIISQLSLAISLFLGE